MALVLVDFYRESNDRKVDDLIFDSNFTTLENLGRINAEGIKFVALQRKSKSLNGKIQQIPDRS